MALASMSPINFSRSKQLYSFSKADRFSRSTRPLYSKLFYSYHYTYPLTIDVIRHPTTSRTLNRRELQVLVMGNDPQGSLNLLLPPHKHII